MITTNTTSGSYITANSHVTTNGTAQIYTTTGTSVATTPWILSGTNTHIDSTLKVKGDAEFEGDIKFKGKSLNHVLSKIEERLAIIHPNEKLEEKWEQLKELGKQYRELEADIIEKEKIWNILRK